MRIERLRLRSVAPAALADFYRRVFDAAPCDLGVIIGAERIEIAAGHDTDPDVFAANETGFQHFAIVVADIGAAYAHLRRFADWRPISLSGPEQLPASSGGAAAFKFRDPEGHPLELLQFPSGAIPTPWRARFADAPDQLFQGIDHTAITVRDAEASEAFYARLGFVCTHRQVNAGAEQARLDGLAEARSATVAIRSLSPPDGARPGVELLEYREPMTVARAARDEGTAATVTVIEGAAKATRPTHDPDGHRLDYAVL